MWYLPRLSIQGCYDQNAVFEATLGRPDAKAVDGDQLGFVAGTENPRPHVAHGAAMTRPRNAPWTWIDPLATTSAPEEAEPSTVTTPKGKMTDWPERIGLSINGEFGS
jgi:hypothetical protein